MDLLWLYDLPHWLFGAIIVSACLAYGLAGLLATRSLVGRLHTPHPQNDVVSFYFAAVCVFYGITLGLLAVGTWSTFSDTEASAQQEASALGGLYRDVSSYPEPVRGQLQDSLRIYTRQVIDVSWPQQRKGIVPNSVLGIVDKFQSQLTTFEPATAGQKALHVETLSGFDQLVQLRIARKQAVSAGLSSSLWAMIVLGCMLTLTVSWFFQTGSFSMHFWMTVMLSSLLGMEMFLIAAMDNPFRGALSIGPDAFELVYQQLMTK